MADSIRILDTQADKWAQERTLIELVSKVGITNEILVEYLKNAMSSDDIKDFTERLEKENKETSDEVVTAIEEASKKESLEERLSRERYEYAVNGLKESLSSSLLSISSSLDMANPGSIFRTLSSNMSSAARSFKEFDTRLAKMVTAVSVLTTIIDKSYERLNQLTEGYVQSYTAGQLYADGLRGFNAIVGESGMSMQTFAGIMTRFSQSFAVLGSARVAELNREFSTLTNNGFSLTMTLAQSQESLMTYVDIIRASGRVQRMTTKDIANSANVFLSSINDLSIASGKSREELLRSTRDALAQPEFQAFIATLDDGTKAAMEQSIASLAVFGAEIQNEFKNFIVAGMAGGTAAMFRNNEAMFLLANQTGQTAEMMQMVQDAAAGKDVSNALMEFTENLKNSTLVQSGQLARLAQFDPKFASMNQLFGRLTTETNSLIASQEMLKATADAMGMSLEEYQEYQTVTSDRFLQANNEMSVAMTKLNAAFNDIILTVIYPILVPAMRLLAGVVTVAVDSILWLTTPIRWASDQLNSFGGIIGDVTGLLVGLAAILGLIVGGRALGRAASTGIGSALGRFLPTGDAATLPGVQGAARSASLPRVGMLGGMLRGLTTSLAAAGGPQALAIIAGAGAIAAAIAIIGAGIGASAYAISVGLPPLVESLKGFAEIDGDNLVTVGAGMLALGGGLIALGLGEVASAIGSFASLVTRLWNGDPIERLKKFEELAEPLSKAAPALNDFSEAFLQATARLNASVLEDSVESSMDKIMSILSADAGGFFGGEPPIIAQINSLADAIARLNQESAELVTTSAVAVGSPGVLSSSDLQKRTLSYYENQRLSNASIIELLNAANQKLEQINNSVVDTNDRTVKAIKQSGNNL